MDIIVAEFITSYQSDTTENEYFECSDWGFKKALEWCEFQLPYDEDHTPRYWKNYIRKFSPEQIEKWTKDFHDHNHVWAYGFQYSSQFNISVVNVTTKEEEE